MLRLEYSGNVNQKSNENTANTSRAYLTFKNGLDETLINKELLAKLLSLSEIIKNLTEENDSLRGENKIIREKQGQHRSSQEETELHTIIQKYQKKAKEMAEKIKELEDKLNETKSDIYGSGDKTRYKTLARKLKEERNMYRDQFDERTNQNKELKIEMDKMSFLISDLREQCKSLQGQIDNTQFHTMEKETQTELDKEFKCLNINNSRKEPMDITPKSYNAIPSTVNKEEKPGKKSKDASVQYNQEELKTDENCISEFDNYSTCSSLTEEFKFDNPRFTDSALLIEEEQDRQEAIEEIQATLISDCYRKQAVHAMEKDKKIEMRNGRSIPWSLASKNFASKLRNDETDDDQDVICTF